MGKIIGYFREHKWQGWLLTASVGLTLGVLGALLRFLRPAPQGGAA